MLVVDKPAGLLAVPGRGADKQDCLASRVQVEFPDALVVHRLDMATSGLMVFARGPIMQRQLSCAFQERLVSKRYVAVVEGRMRAAGEIDLPIVADWPNRPLHKVDAELGKPSLTRYRLMEYDMNRNVSRVGLEPVTGRTHQLRVHLHAVGHPIVGDVLYSGQAASRMMLHAANLSLEHPRSGELCEFASAPTF